MNTNESKVLEALKKIAELDHGHKSSAVAMNAIKEIESQPVAGQEVGEVWYVTNKPDQNGEYGVWLGRHTCAIGATDKSSAIHLCNILNRLSQQPQAPAVEVVEWRQFTSVGNYVCQGCGYSGIIAHIDPETSGIHFCAGCGHPVRFTLLTSKGGQ